MNALTLRHIRYFEALSQHGHFGRAAEACGISQPALSIQMKELEDIVGSPLLERSARQVRLTGVGEVFLLRARDILRAVDELASLARTASEELTGRVRVGLIPTVAPYLLPRVIRALAARFPDLDLRVREAVTQKLVNDLGEGRLDMAIVALPTSEPSLVEHPLFTEEFVLVRPLADAGKPVPRPDLLREMRLLLLEEGHCFRDQALSFCKMSPPGPRDLMEASSLSTLVQMVGAGVGITLIPQMAIETETRVAAVSVAPLEEPRPSRTIGLVWRRTNPLGKQFKTLLDVLKEAIS
ncbi:hydrogen peroxide-inducible genes activator [Aestuariivirga sp.]|uniref:hydrogen peroxide-inducible genes activator n=1 Tax=Aestuariivirga sp. TaxID=2650926 RepID=UPI00391B2D79